jgi:DNA-binding CsgD family transcriptional regulator
MNQIIDHLIEGLQQSRSVEDVNGVLDSLREQLGFDHFLYGVRTPTTVTRHDVNFISDYPSEWLSRYAEQHYVESDPVASHCYTSLLPCVWHQLPTMEEPTAQQVMGEAKEFGLRNGISQGIRDAEGRNIVVSLAGKAKPSPEVVKQGAMVLQVLLPYLYETIRRIGGADVSLPCTLTRRERECLLWSAEGKTAHEIALILSISEATVTFHLKNAIQKLGAVNKSQAVARAVLRRVITL